MQQHEGDRLPRQHFFQQILGQMLVPVKSFASWLFPDVSVPRFSHHVPSAILSVNKMESMAIVK